MDEIDFKPSHIAKSKESARTGVSGLILDALRTYGPMTIADIAIEVKGERSSVQRLVGHLHNETKTLPKRIYIKDWTYEQLGERNYLRALYAVGAKKDTPPPRKKTSAEKTKVSYENRKSATLTSVFDLGIRVGERKRGVRAKLTETQTP